MLLTRVTFFDESKNKCPAKAKLSICSILLL